MKMDLEKDTATIFGKDIALNLTSSGHYYSKWIGQRGFQLKRHFL